ncbi:MAG: DUF72 domain-containing protein [Spirochaetaceae bacterium]|jgi:uncharacterized protein YecE (DUF72 family)|nr:DUF72 domain-containing protein [Spirochaetaceae bacterium]
MADILIGTCGYSYHEWVGPVYPAGTKPGAYLACYAGLFPTVELDFSFYAMPKAENLAKMLLDGGPRVTFSIKAFQGLTHKIDPVRWPDVAKQYLEAIAPLREPLPGFPAGRLEAVLFQFPYQFGYEGENRRYLDKLLKCFEGVPAAVEFRKADWYTGRVIEGMKDRGVPLVALDMPELRGLPPLMDVVTADTAYIRLHGRNKETWWGSDGAARYDYLYGDRELEAWADRIKGIGEQARRILVYFNNHPKGKAAKNALSLEKILKKAGLWHGGEGKDVKHGVLPGMFPAAPPGVPANKPEA